ncbi:MAG: TonB-dependent receptor [Acidobacteria bacterium]|nr:TonB-dependent receptor [Acidobacteriota bacterium]
MKNQFLCLGRVASMLALAAGPALVAQTQTGTLVISVKNQAGTPLPGVRVTVKSDKLQGLRSGVTDNTGYFRAPLLPPGAYSGTITMEGYISASVTATVPLGGSTTAEAVLRPIDTAGVTVTVLATQSKIEKAEVSITENYSQEDILKLPVARTLLGIAQMAPGVTSGVGNPPRAVIGGAATYENKFLVNGADVNDNYFGTDVGLFIEDAVDETQVLTNGVSAEWGRFTGGVINAITKRGGNAFEGSLRATMTNQNWNAVLPNIERYQDPATGATAIAPINYRSTIVNKVNPIYIFTVGGPIIKDKLWFFAAGRTLKTEASNSLPGSGFQYVQTNEEARYEGNLSWQVNDNHRLLASYMTREVKNFNRAPLVANTADPAGLQHRRDPLSLKTLQYNGILSPKVNLDVMWTEKLQRITTSSPKNRGNNGGTAFWQSPVFDTTGLLFNNHYFGNDPEDRDNQSLKATLTMYLTGAGQHQLKVGMEQFKEINNGTNLQSPTGFVVDASGVNYTDVNHITYDFDADSYLEDWSKAPGGKFTSTYTSLFLNDNWTLNNHWNFTLGARFEKWEGSSGNALYAKPGFQDITPRVGINFDPKGDSNWQFNTTFAHYAGKANASIVTAGTYVGNPALSLFAYTGPDASGVTPSAATPGFRRSDYSNTPFYVSDATLNTKLSSDFKAPLTIEWTLGMKHKLSDSANFTLLYVYRNQTRMFEDYKGMYGHVNIGGNDFSIIQWGNVTASEATRVYRSLQGTWEVGSDLYGGRLFWRGNLTLSRLEGNYEGDGGNQPGGGTILGDWPLASPNSAATAYGRLANDEPVRIKTQALWNRPIGNNVLALGFNFDYASGKPYSFTRTAYTTDTFATDFYVDAAYNTYLRYYGKRGIGRFNDVYTMDFSVQWDGKIGPKSGATNRLGYFVKFTAFNVLNNIQLATWNVDGSTARVSPGTPNDVWIARNRFGRPVSPANYIGNRQIQVDFGFKF